MIIHYIFTPCFLSIAADVSTLTSQIVTLLLTSSTTTPSTTTTTTTIATTTVTHWSEWGSWSCSYVSNLCFKSRTRECLSVGCPGSSSEFEQDCSTGCVSMLHLHLITLANINHSLMAQGLIYTMYNYK